MDLEVACTGLAKGKPPEPCVVVIFGVTGDLARTKLIPSLYALGRRGLLPEQFAIIGFARREWDDDSFRQEMHASLQKTGKAVEDAVWRKFAQSLHYLRGDFSTSTSQDFATLRDRISTVRTERALPDHVLFHLSTPPRFYGEITQGLAGSGLLKSSHGWRRVVIEKPFGHNQRAAQALDRQLLAELREEQLFRVDHYLGKETVQNMLVFRFANPGFEPIWNRDHIDHVQITVAENEGIGTRAGHYEETGVVRDMVQNHLLQLLCMTAMDPPVSYDGASLRNETFKVLQAIRPLDVSGDCVLGQYGAGKVMDRAVPAYREEDGVAAGSTTPTFAALKVNLANWRWSGVPFFLRTGKRLTRKVTEITLHFKPTPHLMFPLADPGQLQKNTLTFRLQPDEGILHRFLAKQPGPAMCMQTVTMRFCYETAFGIEDLPGAYEWLLLDAMHGEQTLFPRSDWIDRAWSLVDPLVRHAETSLPRDVPNYAAGSWGPPAADRLLERAGRAWQVA